MGSVYRIGQFAERVGCSVTTVRRWEAAGRITVRRTPSGQRYFDDTDVVRHQLVQRIVRAYDEHKAKAAEQLPLLESRTNGKGTGMTLPEKGDGPPAEVETSE